jgi:hypothetical protein
MPTAHQTTRGPNECKFEMGTGVLPYFVFAVFHQMHITQLKDVDMHVPKYLRVNVIEFTYYVDARVFLNTMAHEIARSCVLQNQFCVIV